MELDINNRFVFDINKENDYEAHYILWNDYKQEIMMMFRYALLKRPNEGGSNIKVWACFWDQKKPENNVGWIKEYPLSDLRLSNNNYRLEIGNSGMDKTSAWGDISNGDKKLRWRFDLDVSNSIAVDRVPGVREYQFFVNFYSSYCRHKINGWVEVNNDHYEIKNINSSDGHYSNIQNLRSWNWGNCVNFKEDPDFLFEGISAYHNDWTTASSWLFFYWKGKRYESNIIDAMFYNRELSSELNRWSFSAEKNGVCFQGQMTADPQTMILLTHPLPDGSSLYTTITLNANLVIDIYEKDSHNEWQKVQTVTAEKATFEVTKPVRNKCVTREFEIL